MKKADIIFIAAVIFIAAAFFILIKLNNKASGYVEVSIDNQVVDCFWLDTDIVKEYDTEKGRNVIVIENGVAYVKEADCRNQICVKTAPVSEYGQSIFCLPHKFSVIVRGK